MNSSRDQQGWIEISACLIALTPKGLPILGALFQLLRLGRISFANKGVQTKFKIGHQSARNKIIIWEEIGLLAQDGTRPSEHGGKPVNRYVIPDPRVTRIVERRLFDVDDIEADDSFSE